MKNNRLIQTLVPSLALLTLSLGCELEEDPSRGNNGGITDNCTDPNAPGCNNNGGCNGKNCTGNTLDDLPEQCHSTSVEDLASACGANAILVGQSGSYLQQRIDFTWDTSSVSGPSKKLRFAIAPDTVGAVFTFQEHGRTVIFDTVSLDGFPVGGYSIPSNLSTISRVLEAWSHVASVGLPSNIQTTPCRFQCLDFELASTSGRAEESPRMTVSSLRRPQAELGQYFDIEFRIVDSSVQSSDIAGIKAAVERAFADSCSGFACPIPVIRAKRLTLETEEDGEIVVDDNVSLSSLYARLSRFDNEDSVSDRALRIIFVNNVYLGQMSDDLVTAGLAGGIPGVPFQGTVGSSLMIAVEPHRYVNTGTIAFDYLAETIVHEIGHTLGLFHTTEASGQRFDPIDDTPECPKSLVGANSSGQIDVGRCVDFDAYNMMFWMAETAGDKHFSKEQAFVMRSHPLMYNQSSGD